MKRRYRVFYYIEVHSDDLKDEISLKDDIREALIEESPYPIINEFGISVEWVSNE